MTLHGFSIRWGRWLCLSLVALLLSLTPLAARSQPAMLSEAIGRMETQLEAEYEAYFDREIAATSQTPTEMAATLNRMAERTGIRHAVLWAMVRDTHLHLVLIAPGGEPIVRDLEDARRDRLEPVVREFYRDLTRRRGPRRQQASQQLHQWLIAPLAAELDAAEIETILFCFGDGLRGLPVAALFDGEQYFLERYSAALIPAFNLVDLETLGLREGQILAMGASEFEQLPALPAVPVELETISATLRESLPAGTPWRGQALLNEAFTSANLRQQLGAQPYAIVHLATHAEFQPGTPDNSYIQLWDDRLSLDQMRQIEWGEPPPALLVLSACRTAVGDSEAELGFAGLALQTGVQSALASRWYVSDAGTLALMGEFYRQLPEAPTKAIALRRAQLRLLRGEVRFEGDRLQLSRGSVAVPDTLAAGAEASLAQPFYWAGFMLLSSP